MRSISFFLFTSIIGCSSIPNQFNAIDNISHGYYTGGDKLFTSVFVEVKNDTAIADFIFIQKYPRRLLTDTLSYSQNTRKWIGRSSILYQKGSNYYTRVTDSSSVFSAKTGMRIVMNTDYYKTHIDEYKNIAVWHECYEDYIRKSENKVEARKRFNELDKRYNLNKLLIHFEFLKELKKMKSELN